MKNMLLAMVMVLFTLSACEKSELGYIQPTEKSGLNPNFPACVSQLIYTIKNEPVRNPRVRIYQYTYNRNTVYYVTSYCCDIPSELYDRNCNLICHPDGGLSGDVDARCRDFFEARANEKLLWIDPRK